MSESVQGAPGACPRCRSTATIARGKSPVAGVWTIFGCTTCFYTWRSTELEENTNPDKYPKAFRLNPAQLATLPVAPIIPPLRRP